MGWSFAPEPYLPARSAVVVPSAIGEKSLSALTILGGYPDIPATAAIVLVKAARLFQDGLWIADAEPALAWIMLVSAVETVAGYSDQTKASSLDTLLRWPGGAALQSLLLSKGVEELLEPIADLLTPVLGSTRKFVNFLLTFCPDPPSERPSAEFERLDWSSDTLKKIYSKVYDCRSKALHAGQPFPSPMCEAPMSVHGRVPAEKPLGLATSTLGAVWPRSDTPIILNTFAWIARTAILKWFTSLTAANPDVPVNEPVENLS